MNFEKHIGAMKFCNVKDTNALVVLKLGGIELIFTKNTLVPPTPILLVQKFETDGCSFFFLISHEPVDRFWRNLEYKYSRDK